MIRLAQTLDALREGGLAYLVETETVINTSNLVAENATSILTLCAELGWATTVRDVGGNDDWAGRALDDIYHPFAVTIQKPTVPDALTVVTNFGFGHFLSSGATSVRWRVARLPSRFATLGSVFMPWDDDTSFTPAAATKNPRMLVREYSGTRSVPTDIQPWLSDGDHAELFGDPTYAIWSNRAVRAILAAVADEIDLEDRSLKFKGPPRLTLAALNDTDDVSLLGADGFRDLQNAAKWVFESEREAEMRHVLLATELARSGGGYSGTIDCIKKEIAPALEGAKIAYQMSLSELGQDTLKVLAELRKSITDETAKLTEATRQLIGAVATSVGIGIGLVVTRTTTGVPSAIIIGITAVVAAYVIMTLYSGRAFLRLQNRLRDDWQPRLYRFLPQAEYEKMVTVPARSAEKTFRVVSWIAIGAIIGLIGTVALTVTHYETEKYTPSPSIPAVVPGTQSLPKGAIDVKPIQDQTPASTGGTASPATGELKSNPLPVPTPHDGDPTNAIGTGQQAAPPKTEDRATPETEDTTKTKNGG